MEERRRLERFSLALPTTVQIVDPKPAVLETSFDSLTRDVSSGGGFFLTPGPPPVGTRVKIEMALVGEHPRQESDYAEMKASGHVVRTEPAGMAVCFNGHCRLVPRV